MEGFVDLSYLKINGLPLAVYKINNTLTNQ